MKERTSLADRYLLEHFYETCSAKTKKRLQCSGVEIDVVDDREYSWLDVVVRGNRKCGKCEYLCEQQGFYYGKGKYSADFYLQEYVTLNKIRTQEEFETICAGINPDVKGMIVRGTVSNASVLERFEKLEYVNFEGHRISHFWNTSYTPNLKIVRICTNKYFQTLSGLENAKKLECLELYTQTSDVCIHKFDSLKPISKLQNLQEIVMSATEPNDHNIEYLIELPNLKYLWMSPNLLPTEKYAEFEAKKFKLSDEYGIFYENSEDIFPYGKGKRIMHSDQQKQRYLSDYRKLLQNMECMILVCNIKILVILNEDFCFV